MFGIRLEGKDSTQVVRTESARLQAKTGKLYRQFFGTTLCWLLIACPEGFAQSDVGSPRLIALGVAQDAGYPQAGCRRACCDRAWQDPSLARWPSCLGIVDPTSGQRWLIECTPDFKQQLHALDTIQPPLNGLGLDGILVTHAHIGHYAGLLNLGREVIGADAIPVHAMPRMREFLKSSGPWDQLVSLQNIELRPLEDRQAVKLNERLSVMPFLVPHRDEYSEAIGFRIVGPNKAALFLPDIDKWSDWSSKIEDELATVDVAFLDATFFDGNELPGRDMSKIPHPFVVETLKRFEQLPASERSKIHFLHFNHTNPLLDHASAEADKVRSAGMHLARQLQEFEL